MKNIFLGIVIVVFSLGGFFLGYDLVQPEENVGGVTIGNEYQYASSTGAGAVLLQTGPTTLGSVIIMTPSAHTFTIKNATSTTDLTGTVVGVLEASAVEGTYEFDIRLDKGLVVEPASSFAGQYVTTYRK